MQSYSNLEPQILLGASFPCYSALEKYSEYFFVLKNAKANKRIRVRKDVAERIRIFVLLGAGCVVICIIS
jgi:hypothetical protein